MYFQNDEEVDSILTKSNYETSIYALSFTFYNNKVTGQKKAGLKFAYQSEKNEQNTFSRRWFRYIRIFQK